MFHNITVTKCHTKDGTVLLQLGMIMTRILKNWILTFWSYSIMAFCNSIIYDSGCNQFSSQICMFCVWTAHVVLFDCS